MSSERGGPLPAVRVSADGARALRHLRPWVWRKDVLEPPDAPGGAVVAVLDPRGQPAGQALWAARSPLALRLLTRRAPADERVDAGWFRARLEASIARRAPLGREALRLVHGEADGLPGLFVDRYRDRLVLQTLSEGMDARKESLAEALRALTGAVQVVCRDDGSGRDFEQLPRESRVLHGPADTEVEWREGESLFRADLLRDMKTGAFLDQAENHLRAAELGRGRALDAFSYHGGFALALAARCDSVLALEQDPVAARRLLENIQRNGRRNVEAREANAFDVLHQLDRDGERFDTVVLDPPAFAKSKGAVEKAQRGYKEINLRAFHLLNPGGVLITCSCSFHIDEAQFERTVLSAATDARRNVQVVERRGAARDHPTLLGVPETRYLKCLILRVL
jgi:23S rRNA (cytosine1962-C5)-methyltransferase